jgi:hypothetical protein
MNTDREWTRIETRMNANHGISTADKHRWTQVRLVLSTVICIGSAALAPDLPGGRLASR